MGSAAEAYGIGDVAIGTWFKKGNGDNTIDANERTRAKGSYAAPRSARARMPAATTAMP